MINIFDGAMGTMLQNSGLKPGDCPELLNITNPAIVQSVHSKYIDHGANIIETNTFGANRIKLAHYGLSDKVVEINTAAVNIARSAARASTKIAGSVGSTGKFIEPIGELTFDECYEVFFEQISALSNSGVDYIIIETIIDIQEMRAALLAAKQATKKPIICQLSFNEDGRTVTGTDAETAAITLEALGADIIGANCSLGPEQLLPIIEVIAKTTSCPISIQPNAGMPQLINGETIFPMSPVEFGAWVPKLIAAGATFIGGCCGTTPEHIKAIAATSQNITPPKRSKKPRKLALTSRSKTVWVDAKLPTVLIGERINPTGRKKMAAEIREGNFLSVKKDALEQINAGASILDVNMGVGGIDQAKAMAKAIKEISQLVDAPLAIDTSDAKALEAGLKAYPGRALINSVSAEPERLKDFLPLAKKYGAAILCLPVSASGIAKTAPERLQVITEIITAARKVGLTDGDFLLDALVMTIAADERACCETLATLNLYRQTLGFPTTMGLSNISFGLPNRPLINSTFFTMCLAAGLDAPIMNPYLEIMQDALQASNVLLGKDKNGRYFSVLQTKKQTAETQPAVTSANNTIIDLLKQSIINGEKEAVSDLIPQALQAGYQIKDITDNALTAAMNKIGDDFGAGKIFLPQVLLAAEAMHNAFSLLKSILPVNTIKSVGTIVIATVKGDIHDLGKNIVAALLENNGFKVIDLGKDVEQSTIIETAIAQQADIVGLCALMTTTMPQIDLVIAGLKQANCPAKVMVGGAVLTQEYADHAGADCYAADGIIAVNLAKNIING